MKKRVIFIVVTALLCCLLVACGSKTRLQAPQNIRQNGPFLIWDEVKNAEGYIVLADNEEYVTAEPSCNLSFLGGETVYVVKIKAVGDGENFADSDWSEFGFNEIFKYTLLADGSGYEVNLSVSSVELQDRKVVVPSTYENLPVTRIADKMFYKCASLTEVVLPSTLKEIMGMAFRNCEALKTVVLPSSLEDIGKDAFYMCPLESVFFDGTEAEFLSVSVAEGNDSILSAAVYFYSETEPTENPQKFWRFSGGKPLPWA